MPAPLNIIAVDDEPFNLMLIEELAALKGLKVKTFLSPVEALRYVQEETVDLLLTDYMMPEIDGIELIRRCRAVKPDILSVVITATSDSEEVKLQALEAGATDFLTKPINAVEFQLRVQNLATIRKSQLFLSGFNETLKQEVAIATEKLIQREHEALVVLSSTAEYRDPETASHISRVAHYSKLMAEGYGLDQEEQERIFYASPLHDVGKVGIKDEILLKPGKLTDEEFEYMKTHAEIGYEILKNCENPFLKAGAVIARSHHEKFDGSGYPRGIKGEDIPLYGRITAIADVFDALTSHRPYKKAWSFEEAFEFIRDQSGAHFDPKLVKIFIDNAEAVRKIYTTFAEE
jgi:response regulator RpfG family c-di-GMP phosphodiesterase